MSLEEKKESIDSFGKQNDLHSKSAESNTLGLKIIWKELISSLRKMLGDQVIWGGIAAIGGALIAIWNILRYILTFLSSFFRHLQTNVPVYLLMKGSDHGITDVRLFLSTALVIIIILTFTYPIPVPKRMITYFTFISGMFSTFVILIMSAIYFDDIKMLEPRYYNDPIIRIFIKTDDSIILYLLFACLMLTIIISGIQYTSTKKEFYSIKNKYLSLQGRVSAISQEYRAIKKLYLDNKELEATTDNPVYYELIEKRKAVLSHGQRQKDIAQMLYSSGNELRRNKKGTLPLIVYTVIFFILITYHSPYYLIDQNNRIIIADLGDQYVVQEAVIDNGRGIIAVDNTNFSIVNSVNENIKVSKYKLNKIADIKATDESENEITIETLKTLIGKKKGDIPYDIGKCLWDGKIYFETTDRLILYGNKGNVIFEISGGVVVRAFWLSYTLHEEVSNPNEELDRLINLIGESTGLKEQEMYPDELSWQSDADNINYFMVFHEVPLIIGVEIKSNPN